MPVSAPASNTFRGRLFESSRPSQRVRFLRVNKRMSLKTARKADVALSLCANLAMEAPFLPPVSEALFRYLVFDGRIT